MAHKVSGAALAGLKTTVKENMDARTLTKLIIHRLRVILLMRYAPELAEQLSLELTDTDREFALGASKEPAVNSDMLRTILDAYGKMAYAAVPHLPLELAIIDICATQPAKQG
jgi:hypothetical protein